MTLVRSVLVGNNYLAWTRFIKIVLGAKLKLGFIIVFVLAKIYPIMNNGFVSIAWWLQILNSIAKDVVEAFSYTWTAKKLWNELQEWFGVSKAASLSVTKIDKLNLSKGS